MRSVFAAAKRFLPCDGMSGIVLVERTATRDTFGSTCFTSSSRLPASVLLRSVVPVMLPPGRARLVTKPLATGSFATAMTIGIVRVAFLAARVAWLPATMMMATLRSTSSLASRIECSLPAVREAVLDHDVAPRHIATIAQSLLERVDVVLRRRDDAQESESHGGPRRCARSMPASPARRAAQRQGTPAGPSLDYLVARARTGWNVKPYPLAVSEIDHRLRTSSAARRRPRRCSTLRIMST